ncbi:hypothetical protein AAG570_011411 [Ranatra chinensis]|uniref:PHD-type domain-containing protein n=1 Tax=Ranatra chinensis TaxID=642074 RepID=A0ABD0YKS4_9HEMI
MQRRDGNFYLGTVVQIDSPREQCLVKFGDNTESWSVYSRLTKLSTGFDVTCVKCKTSLTKEHNDIVVCDRCSRGYHQLCHMPEIKSEDANPGSRWECARCEELPGKRFLPLRKSSTPLGTLTPQPQAPSQPALTVATDAHRKKLPYKVQLPSHLGDLQWDMQHRVNAEEKYCYCGGRGKWFLQMLQCGRCRQWFHARCITPLSYPLFLGDRFFVFVCSLCNSGKEFVRRLEVKWVDLVHLAVFHLTLQTAKKYLDVDADIINFINTNWNLLQLPPKIRSTNIAERREIVMAVLTSNRNRFKCGREVKKRTTMWGLRVRVPPPTPVFSLPPNKPLSEQVLKDAWHNNARLKFLPPPSGCVNLIPSKSELMILDISEDSLPGLATLHIETRPLVLPKGVPTTGHNVCIKSSVPRFPESRAEIERRIKAQGVENQRLRSFRARKARKLLKNAIAKSQDLPPTPPSSESNPEVRMGSHETTSGDESSSRGTLDSFIPPPTDFEGRNNPFLHCALPPLALAPVLRPTKRRLSEKDIVITSNGEVKRRRIRRRGGTPAPGAGGGGSRRGCKSGPTATTTPSSGSPVKPSAPFNLEDLKTSVNHYFGAMNRIAAGEKFFIRAKRISPQGRTQYLIDWGCSTT